MLKAEKSKRALVLKQMALMHLEHLDSNDIEIACLVINALALPQASESVRMVALSALVRRFTERMVG